MDLTNYKNRLALMKRKIFVLGCPLLLALLAISETASLECYRCSDAHNTHECKEVETCNEGQVCYKRREFTDQVQFDLGCIDKKRCGKYFKLQNASNIAKMSADQTSYCYECCSRDRCNKDLCEYPPHSLCKDDESIDCAKWNSMFSICTIASEARKVCPRYCNLCNLVDGKWSTWSQWSSCDVTCGKGSLSRHRSCNNPAPQNGGLDCPGKATEMKTCRLKLCPVHGGWSSWENWGTCSATCGVGMRNRKRSCTDPHPKRFGDSCYGESIGYELCNNGSCAVNGGWSYWSNWGQCSVTCGVGLHSRTRSCTNPTPENAGHFCVGQNIENKLCYLELCTGVWGNWQAWGDCSVECGRGVQTRKRTCVKDFVFTANCKGNETDKKTCEITNCSTDCYDIRNYFGKQDSGVYIIKLWKSKILIPVYCDFDTDKGGWTVFHYRFNGSVDFHRNMTEYRTGFGSLNGEFWLGLDYIYEMVLQGKSELRLDLTASNGDTAYETFQNFRLERGPSYTLRIDSGVGSAGDSGHGLSYHNGQKFTTYDFDQDTSKGNCAISHKGGWWYKSCYYVNLNGDYSRNNYYYPFKERKPLKETRMMFRRV